MSFVIKDTHVVKLTKKDDEFFLVDNDTTLIPRASIEISEDCPSNIVNIIHTAYSNGWLNLVAYQYAKTLTFDKLR